VKKVSSCRNGVREEFGLNENFAADVNWGRGGDDSFHSLNVSRFVNLSHEKKKQETDPNFAQDKIWLNYGQLIPKRVEEGKK
jgi:hypothetical protein